MYSVKYFNDENGDLYFTVFQGEKHETVRIKPICCKKYLEPGKGLCTGCPELQEQERISRLLLRIEKNNNDLS